jgi:hypothetical protein
MEGSFLGFTGLNMGGCQRAIIYKTIMQIYMNIMQKFALKTITESSVQGMGLVPSEVPMRNLGKGEFLNGQFFSLKKGN